MLRTAMTALAGVLIISGTISAQTPVRLRWQKGQVLLYKVDQATAATQVVGENKVQTTTRLNLTKRWEVLDVDGNGVATVQHSLTALRLETVAPNGDNLLFDSANPDKSTPQMRDSMGKFLNVPLAILRVDGLGRVLEVKESRFGPASGFENEPPFVGVLPMDAIRAGMTWQRNYNVTLDPPKGAGEKYAAVQNYSCKSVGDGMAVVALTTELKAQPDAIADRVPLLQMQPEGEIIYDLMNGRFHRATLKIDKELRGQQGEGSSARFTSTYVEQYVGDR